MERQTRGLFTAKYCRLENRSTSNINQTILFVSTTYIVYPKYSKAYVHAFRVFKVRSWSFFSLILYKTLYSNWGRKQTHGLFQKMSTIIWRIILRGLGMMMGVYFRGTISIEIRFWKCSYLFDFPLEQPVLSGIINNIAENYFYFNKLVLAGCYMHVLVYVCSGWKLKHNM